MTEYHPGSERVRLLERERREVRRLYDRHMHNIKKIIHESTENSLKCAAGFMFMPSLLYAEKLREKMNKKDQIEENDTAGMLGIFGHLLGKLGVDAGFLRSMSPKDLRTHFMRTTDDLEKQWAQYYKIYAQNMEKLQRELARSNEEFAPRDIRETAQHTLHTYIKNMPQATDELQKLFLQKDLPSMDVIDISRAAMDAYYKAIAQWKPVLSRQRLQKIAATMQNNLEAAIQEEERIKKRGSATPERKMLAFAFYQLESKRIAGEGNNDSEYDLSRLEDLEDQAKEVMEDLKPLGEEKNGALITALRKKGYIRDEEVSFLNTIIAKLYERQREGRSLVQDDADRDLCRGWLSEMYGFSGDVIRPLLPHLTSEEITRVEDALDKTTGAVVRRNLVKANPALLLMGIRETERYLALLQSTINVCRPYVQDSGDAFREFDIGENPSSFASRKALIKSQQSLEAMVKKGGQEQQERSLMDTFKEELQKEGFDSGQILTTLQGFRHKGTYFWGRHGMDKDSLLANISKAGGGIDDRTVDKVVRQLQRTGAIIDTNGKLSLNPHFGEISSPAVRAMLRHISRSGRAE